MGQILMWQSQAFASLIPYLLQGEGHCSGFSAREAR